MLEKVKSNAMIFYMNYQDYFYRETYEEKCVGMQIFRKGYEAGRAQNQLEN